MRIPQPKLNLIELTMLGALVAALGFMAGIYYTASWLQPFVSSGAIELQQLAPTTGPPRNSRGGEEWIVRDYFGSQREGVFLDVGANHYQRDSNTYYLETQLGWSGLAIEPQIKFAADYALHRPLTKFIPLFVSDVSNREAVLYVPLNDVEASSDRNFAEGKSESSVTPMTTNTATLDDILNHHGVRTIDFLSMDIELHEPQALNGFSIERFRPRLICIEAHVGVRQQILDYFTNHGYVVVGKYLRADSENLWFAPLKPRGIDAPLVADGSQ